MSSYKVERYRDIKNVFNNITSIGDPAFCNYVELKENSDALVLNFIVKSPMVEGKIDYYYQFGDSQVHRFLNDQDERVMTINPEKLHNHVMMDINDFVRGKAIA